MPRNSSGTYALPAGNPVVTNTLIQSTWANTTLSDVSTAMTDSLDRNGRGAMLAPLKNVDGTAVAPAMSFSSEGTLGIYRVSAGVLGFSAGGALVLSIAAAGLTFTNPIILPIGSATAPSLTFVANTNTGLYSPTTNQVGVTTNGAQRLLIDATGNVSLTTGALVFPAAAAGVIEASNAAGTLALQTGGANTRLSIDAAGVVTVAQTTVLTGAVGIGGANALGKLQVFGGAVVIDNAQAYAAKSSGGTANNLLGLDASNNLQVGSGSGVATQQFATGGTVRVTIDGSGNVGIGNTPGARLDVSTGTTNRLRVSEATSTLFFDSLNNAASAWAPKNERATLFNWLSTPSGGPTTGMTLDGSGNLIVGATTTPYTALRLGVKIGSEGAGVGNPNGFAVARTANDSMLYLGYSSGSDTWIIGATYSSTGAYKPLTFATSDTARMQITAGGIIQDGAGNELGYKGLPQNSQGAGYTLTASDRGKQVYMNNVGNVTVPAGVFSTGDVITLINGEAGTFSLVQGASTTLYQAGTSNTGNRTVLTHGICTVVCTQSSTNSFFVSGNIT